MGESIPTAVAPEKLRRDATLLAAPPTTLAALPTRTAPGEVIRVSNWLGRLVVGLRSRVMFLGSCLIE